MAQNAALTEFDSQQNELRRQAATCAPRFGLTAMKTQDVADEKSSARLDVSTLPLTLKRERLQQRRNAPYARGGGQ